MRLSVEYGASSTVCTALIAPPDYHPGARIPENNMDDKVVDQIFEAILPGILTTQSGRSLMTVVSRNSFLQTQY
ncbi:MAG: hypothetical protein JOY85_12570 [Acidobacteriaceae bacterium]|nr:hypothetical protein [Acidobacteriaceae bacterium]